jgi:hypothetical protein
VTYDRGGLGSFDGETVGFDWGSGSFLVAFAVLALDLHEGVISLGEGPDGWANIPLLS